MRLITLAAALILAVALAHARTAGPTTSTGPERIACKNAPLCEIGIGTPSKRKFQVNVEALPDADKDRLSKQCKPADKTLCLVTAWGTEIGYPMKVQVAKTSWYK